MMHRIPSCPVCGNNQLVISLTSIDYTTSGEVFAIEKCTTCGLMLTNPQPEAAELGKYYESSSYTSHTVNSQNLLDKLYTLARMYALRWKLGLVKKYAGQPAKLLDLGCGVGDFLKVCKDNQMSIAGVEPSAHARKVAEQKTSITIARQFEPEGESFDVITAWHVLEHIPDLAQTLKAMHQRLTENGTMFIAVPNHESYDAKNFGAHWAAYDVPRHLWHFTKQSINRLFAQQGFNMVAIEPMKLDSYYVSLLSEKYKRKKLSALGILSAFTTGLISNLKARRSTNYSSLVYVFRKK
jgi:2-polyprenyl-3-methyl-5-hydroxy-6-metoxy-1,4-benzoquinol methylase